MSLSKKMFLVNLKIKCKMSIEYTIMSCVLACIISCKKGSDNITHERNDSIQVSTKQDSLSTSYEGWTPEEFKKEHYDEWFVVEQSINLQNEEGDIDFKEIDKLVGQYIKKKNIVLPENKYRRIKKIEQICRTRFDISEYYEKNTAIYIVQNTNDLFSNYIVWILANEAKTIIDNGINIIEEDNIIKPVIAAFSNCCDSIGYAFEGSGGWNGELHVNIIEQDFKKSMYEAVLNPQGHKKLSFLLTPKHFRIECDKRIKHYTPSDYSATSPDDAKRLLNNYYYAMKKWLDYRKKTEKHIPNRRIRNEYSYITRSFARTQYIHLKNVFGDIGMCSTGMYEECYLHHDCSDKEMLNYSFEKAYARYINE